MALATRPRPQVSVNLLPPQVRAQHQIKRWYRMALTGLVGLAVVLLGYAVLQRLQIADAERTLEQERARAQALETRVNGLREFSALKTSVDSSRKTLATALTADVAWSRFLDDLDTVIPGDSWLVSLALTAKPGQTPDGQSSLGTANYQGYVKTFPGLSNWLDTMSKLDGLRFVYLANGRKQDLEGQKVISFTASSHLTEKMLSGRCVKEGVACP